MTEPSCWRCQQNPRCSWHGEECRAVVPKCKDPSPLGSEGLHNPQSCKCTATQGQQNQSSECPRRTCHQQSPGNWSVPSLEHSWAHKTTSGCCSLPSSSTGKPHSVLSADNKTQLISGCSPERKCRPAGRSSRQLHTNLTSAS